MPYGLTSKGISSINEKREKSEKTKLVLHALRIPRNPFVTANDKDDKNLKPVAQLMQPSIKRSAYE